MRTASTHLSWKYAMTESGGSNMVYVILLITASSALLKCGKRKP